ncbi:hypothetical protein E4U42_002115 [Claviceps africana]|uniref:Endo-1,4-beta-xylanase n=1 Tax=Claviceps africana TaxID=83212 RepID=A0A8K0NMI1_9HYPO|nr:hypothetical protein E4U42_002115 [Claviceps africana]
MRLSAVTLLAGLMSSVSAAPAAAEVHSLDRRLSRQGQKDGFFYSLWADYNGVSYKNGDKGHFEVNWKKGGNVVAGKGFKPAKGSITFEGSWDCDGNCYLSVYGWSEDPLVECYIVENYGTYNPAGSGKKKGSVKVDGSIYDIYVAQRKHAPSVASANGGIADFPQYWSIRQDKRFNGTVSTDKHIAAWKSLGLEMGELDETILAVEGYFSTGSASFTVT